MSFSLTEVIVLFGIGMVVGVMLEFLINDKVIAMLSEHRKAKVRKNMAIIRREAKVTRLKSTRYKLNKEYDCKAIEKLAVGMAKISPDEIAKCDNVRVSLDFINSVFSTGYPTIINSQSRSTLFDAVSRLLTKNINKEAKEDFIQFINLTKQTQEYNL